MIRDEKGVVIVAFSCFYGSGSNNVVEVCVLADGLSMCAKLELNCTRLRFSLIPSWLCNGGKMIQIFLGSLEGNGRRSNKSRPCCE